MTTVQRLPVQVWTASELRSLKWGSIAIGVTVGLFLPRGLRRYAALAAGALAIKPLMALLHEDSLILTNDRPLHVEPTAGHAGISPTALEGAEAAD